jgi:L-alanine-DL-glutamate epimerase-like enolase superfamily enzyme
MEMIKKARGYGLKVMLGCMNESTLGTAALVHLAPMADFLDADGPLLLREDIAVGLEMESHKWVPRVKPGLGIEMQLGKIFG